MRTKAPSLAISSKAVRAAARLVVVEMDGLLLMLEMVFLANVCCRKAVVERERIRVVEVVVRRVVV